MTTTDTMDTLATVEQTLRCVAAGADMVRITAPSIKEAENLLNIKNELKKRGCNVPLIADIHFTPNAAEVAARIIEKVRVNPGNYVDKKKFEQIDYTDAEYEEEIDRIRERFTPLVKICKEYGTAMRIGTNHGSLSDRIMSRYGDTPMGMVESAMEFLRIARGEDYHNIVLSMKSSNPQVMVQAYRLLISKMYEEFNECYSLHLGVTEAGDGEDGRIKSAIGIGTLLEDGIGDTIRVSLTEDPEFEIPVCKDIVQSLPNPSEVGANVPPIIKLSAYNPFEYKRRSSFTVQNIGGEHVPVVVADFSKVDKITPESLETIGYKYDTVTDKWTIGDSAADYLFTVNKEVDFALPGTLRVIQYYTAWLNTKDKTNHYPILDTNQYMYGTFQKSETINFVMIDAYSEGHSQPALTDIFAKLTKDKTAVVCVSTTNKNALQSIRRLLVEMTDNGVKNPVIIISDSNDASNDASLIHYAVETGGLLLDGFGDGICLGHQLLALANNIATFKMNHGHRGLNHPVKNLVTGLCEITTQNHGFGVVPEEVNNHPEIEITHINLNDNSIEGIRVKNKPAFSVQYHPEATPGPHDSRYLFDDFAKLML